MSDFKNILSKLNRNTILVAIAVIGIIITGGLIYADSNPEFSLSSVFGASDNNLAQKAIDYINNNNLSGGEPVTLVGASKESGLVKIKIKIGESEFDSYVSRDGNLLFPQAFVMGEKEVK